MQNSQTKCHHPGLCTFSQNTEDHTERKEEVQGRRRQKRCINSIMRPHTDNWDTAAIIYSNGVRSPNRLEYQGWN